MKIEQFSLFNQGPQLFKKDTAPIVKKTREFPNIALSFGLDRRSLQDEGMMVLRILANRYLKAMQQKQNSKKLLQTLKNEIKIKKGILPHHLCIQNVLILDACL